MVVYAVREQAKKIIKEHLEGNTIFKNRQV